MNDETLAFDFFYGGVNVTKEIYKRCLHNNQLVLPNEYCQMLSQLHIPASQKLVIINRDSGLRTIAKINTPLVINLEKKKQPKVKVVYFIACTFADHWKEFLRVHLGFINKIYIDTKPDVHVCANIAYPEQEKELLRELDGISIEAELTTNLGNDYEWVGINKVSELAREYPEEVLLYYHSKGISYKNASPFFMYDGFDDGINPIGLSAVFTRYKEILEIFRTFDNVMNVTPWGSSSGKGWHNFWWSRCSYLRQLEVLDKSHGRLRHDYERWLGRGLRNDSVTESDWEKVKMIVYNLDARKTNIGSYFHPQETTGPLIE